MQQMTLLHTNDTHSYLDNYAKRKHLFDMIKSENTNVLTVDVGDNLQGGLYYSVFHGEKEPQLLNALQYDYVTLGNHEFDNGSAEAYHFTKQLQMPVVLSNVDVHQDKLLSQLNNYKSYMIHSFNQLKIGILGLLTPTTRTSSSPSRQTQFNDPIMVAREMVSQLREEVDIVIVLSHLGDDEDIKLAKSVSGIHYIIGSHTHRVIQDPIVITNDEEWQTTILQAGSYGQYVGQLDIVVDNGNVQTKAYQLIDLETYDSFDDSLQQQINQWQQTLKEVTEKPIAVLDEDLIGKRDMTKYQSTNLTNLITDAYFAKVQELGLKPDLAIMNSGGIRQSIQKGVVTYGNILQVLPFGCDLVVCQMRGEDIFKALNEGEYPQVSHAKLVYERRDDGVTLVDLAIKVGNDYEPIDVTKCYTVVTNTYIASGKDEYVGFETTENLLRDKITDTDLVVDYVKQLPQPIRYTNEVRKMIREM